MPQLPGSGEGGVHEPRHAADPRPRADRTAGTPAGRRPPRVTARRAASTAINDPLRTLLGPVQKAAFKADLLASTAKFKIVLSEDAIQQFYALPYDRWEGYGGERSEILNYIRTNDISNVVFLTTDLHANIANDVFIDSTTDSTADRVRGDQRSDRDEHVQARDPQRVPEQWPCARSTALQAVLSIQGVDCRAIDVYSYQLVDVNAGAGTLTVSSRDKNGNVVSDDVTPTTKCTKTLRWSVARPVHETQTKAVPHSSEWGTAASRSCNAISVSRSFASHR